MCQFFAGGCWAKSAPNLGPAGWHERERERERIESLAGEKDGLDLPYWYDNETLFMASAWMLYAYSLAKKSQVKWELPTGSFNGTSVPRLVWFYVRLGESL